MTFSSPELKGHMRYCRHFVSMSNFSTFSSQKPHGQLKPNMYGPLQSFLCSYPNTHSKTTGPWWQYECFIVCGLFHFSTYFDDFYTYSMLWEFQI